jgi:hypothetical protein
MIEANPVVPGDATPVAETAPRGGRRKPVKGSGKPSGRSSARPQTLPVLIDRLMALSADLPATRRKTKLGRAESRRGVVAMPPDAARAMVGTPAALTRAIDARHVSALRETMSVGAWIEDSSVIQIHVVSGDQPHLFIVDGAHRLAAIGGLRTPLPVLVVLRVFDRPDLAADVGGYDAANSQKAQSISARARTIARRAAPDGWKDAEANDKASIRGAVRYGTLVQQGYRFGARAPARNLPMTRVMDAAFDVFGRVRGLVAAIGTPSSPVARLLASDAVLALLALAGSEGLNAEAFVREALATGPVNRELAKVAGRKHAGGSGAVIEVQAVAAGLLWRAGLSEGEALRAVYQDRQVDIGTRTVRF